MRTILTIIVTHNALAWIDKCLTSLANSSTQTKILVVDNQSYDGTPAYIRTKYPDIKIIENRQNLGFGSGNNIGLAEAIADKFDFAFLLNQDAWVETNTIENLVSAHSPKYAILSPVHLNGIGDAIDTSFANYMLDSLTPEMLSDIYLNKPKPLYEIKFANAAAWLLDIKCAKTIGGFDPSFFLYGEDDNYILRAQYHGFKIGLCPSSIIHHERECRAEGIRTDYFERKKKILVFCKDLNRALFNQIARAFFHFCKTMAIDVSHLRFNKLVNHFRIALFFLISLPGIIKSRGRARQQGAFLTTTNNKYFNKFF